MKDAGDKSLLCVCRERGTLAGLLACIGLAALAIGCGVEPTAEEEAADRASLSAQEATVPVAPTLSPRRPVFPGALGFVKPPRLPIVRPALPCPPGSSPCPSPLPSLEPQEAHPLTTGPVVRGAND